MSAGRSRLAAYLDQRRRMGEPAVVPEGLAPGELLGLAAADDGNRALRDRQGIAPSGRRGERATTRAGAVEIGTAGYRDLRETAMACTRCRLCEGRTTVVFSDGNPDARLMVVGEAPGADEDASGVPFVGRAGKLLDLMLASVSLSRRESVYICNVLKCRPPGNRNPLPEEIESCAPLLKRQIELVAPEVLLAVGSFAAQWLTSTTKAVGKLRGRVYGYQGLPLVVTYHPAALLRNPGWSRPVWEDLQLLCQIMDRK
ncbi:MAG: uracil-DNA glycosylase [Gemmatimonadota bacterium]|nr:uracil-DNA glycosylase [Gemmatimonadota bacterium]